MRLNVRMHLLLALLGPPYVHLKFTLQSDTSSIQYIQYVHANTNFTKQAIDNHYNVYHAPPHTTITTVCMAQKGHHTLNQRDNSTYWAAAPCRLTRRIAEHNHSLSGLRDRS